MIYVNRMRIYVVPFRAACGAGQANDRCRQVRIKREKNGGENAPMTCFARMESDGRSARVLAGVTNCVIRVSATAALIAGRM